MNALASRRDSSPTASSHDATAAVAPARSGRVLLVEDDTATCRVAALLLKRAGYRVDTAEDGERGWAALCATPYDVLVTDNEMPRLTGIKLIERLRSAGLTLPVILASGSRDLGEVGDYPEFALAAVLHKPFSFEDLTEAVRRVAPPGLSAAEGGAAWPGSWAADPSQESPDPNPLDQTYECTTCRA